ncbi:venom metalloproteinase antarease TserMP_A-like [Haemaphysalis longicornis]
MLALGTDAMKNRALLLLLLAFINRSQAEILLVYPKLLQSRAEDGSMVLHIHDQLKLNLQKSSVVAPQLLFRTAAGNTSDEVYLNGRELEKNLYHDNKHQSSVVVKQLQGDLEVRGILNHELRIEPLTTGQRSDDGTTLHKVFKVKERMSEPVPSFRWRPANIRPWWQIRPPTTTAAPTVSNDVFVVELCVITSKGYRDAFKSTQELLTYLIIVLNAVCLRYVDMTLPRISFQLNAVTASQDDHLMGRTHHGLDISETLKKVKKAAEHTDYSRCDLVFFVTKARFFDGPNLFTVVSGLAYVGSICGDGKVGVGEDEPHSYDGVYTMAHEMCHSLGATHDGNEPIPYIPGHPGAKMCPWKEGYLMSYEDGGVKKYTLSQCSISQLRVFIKTLSNTCIQVMFQTSYRSEKYPGQTITADKFCEIMHPKTEVMAYNRNDQAYQQCKLECCWVTGVTEYQRKYLCRQYSMPEAMKCGSHMTCRRGVCKAHNWRIP